MNKKNNKITCKKYTRFFLFLLLSNINISDDKVHNFAVNIVDLNEFISLSTTKDSKFILDISIDQSERSILFTAALVLPKKYEVFLCSRN